MAHRSSDEAAYPWLSEFLCEYVDGTMDPAARAMFEECVRGNPDLMAHVERLCAARKMLCAYGCKDLRAPCDLHALLHQRIALESQARSARPLPTHLSVMTLVFATLLVVMVSSLSLPPDERVRPSTAMITSQPDASAFAPALYRDRAPMLPDTLPRSGAMLRIRATLSGGQPVP